MLPVIDRKANGQRNTDNKCDSDPDNPSGSSITRAMRTPKTNRLKLRLVVTPRIMTIHRAISRLDSSLRARG